MAVTFCEVAALAPGNIAHVLKDADDLRFQLESYGKMRKALEDQMKIDEGFDLDATMDSLNKQHQIDSEAHAAKMAASPRSGKRLKGEFARDTDMKALSVQIRQMQHRIDSLAEDVEAKFDQIMLALQTRR